MGAPGLGTGSVTCSPQGGVNQFLETPGEQDGSTVPPRGQDDQEGLSKPGAPVISLCTMETIGFGGNHLVGKCQDSCKSNQRLCQQGGKGWLPAKGLELRIMRRN